MTTPHLFPDSHSASARQGVGGIGVVVYGFILLMTVELDVLIAVAEVLEVGFAVFVCTHLPPKTLKKL